MEVKFMVLYFIKMVLFMKEDLIIMVNLMAKENIFGQKLKLNMKVIGLMIK